MNHNCDHDNYDDYHMIIFIIVSISFIIFLTEAVISTRRSFNPANESEL